MLDEYRKLRGAAAFEEWTDADTLVYTAAALAGENVDRESMAVEEQDCSRMTDVLKQAKQKGMKTVVLLNISGLVEMADWLPYADAVLCIFIPGCMGGVAAARLLAGLAEPGGRLPVTFPIRYEDTPAYPNFPGEGNDAYYGEGVFVGYRSYAKRKLAVQYPFGYGLGYTDFAVELCENDFRWDMRTQETLNVPVRVKNVGSRPGSEVVQLYAREEKPHMLRPDRTLVGYAKARLAPGEETVVNVSVSKKALRCYDALLDKWVQPTSLLCICQILKNIVLSLLCDRTRLAATFCRHFIGGKWQHQCCAVWIKALHNFWLLPTLFLPDSTDARQAASCVLTNID